MTVASQPDTLDLSRYPRIHFVGIGGISMSALARVLITQGHSVTGSDRSPGDQTEALQECGVAIHIGHEPENIEGADLVVITSAVKEDNLEVQAARERGVAVVKRADVLAALSNTGYGIAVAGTHGKTTTSSLIAFLLNEAGRDPTALLGGVSKDLGSNMRVGESNLVVVEADEYDRTFLRLHPQVAVITNVAAEHLDCYGTEEQVFEAFRQFVNQVSDLLVICSDEPELVALTASVPVRKITYGLNSGNWRAENIREQEGHMRFSVRHDGDSIEVSTLLAGRHNAANILGAMAVCNELGVADHALVAALSRFSGVGRRLDVKGEAHGVLIIDDYAVHPTEVRAILAAIRTRFDRPIRVIFQPHTYSRVRDFLDDFARSFTDAHAVYVMDIYAARETDTLGMSASVITEVLAAHHPQVICTGSTDATISCIATDVQPGDVVVTMGAGDVTRLGPIILNALASDTVLTNREM